MRTFVSAGHIGALFDYLVIEGITRETKGLPPKQDWPMFYLAALIDENVEMRALKAELKKARRFVTRQ